MVLDFMIQIADKDNEHQVTDETPKRSFFWFCCWLLLHDFLDHSLIDRIPGHQNDRKTLLGELIGFLLQ
ncbi:regulatory-associated protein of TOR 2 isoform X1 [Iris pallida]|uniref:Regulatory-associated protein of TOR 2 isoform X1 n=1 Tax=Iris pallida TaxID=29817 RepID=A0AAX6EPP9_IRIPA|nr:regulatory-associated protein of TOR 2 isoform X1 [Iris pallida]